ncbi:hypothetical protein ACJX0J_034498, partial [Zea mays]
HLLRMILPPIENDFGTLENNLVAIDLSYFNTGLSNLNFKIGGPNDLVFRKNLKKYFFIQSLYRVRAIWEIVVAGCILATRDVDAKDRIRRGIHISSFGIFGTFWSHMREAGLIHISSFGGAGVVHNVGRLL